MDITEKKQFKWSKMLANGLQIAGKTKAFFSSLILPDKATNTMSERKVNVSSLHTI